MFRNSIILVSIFVLAGCFSGKEEQLSVQSEATETKNILALGASLSAGYGLDISDSYPSKLGVVLEQSGYNYNVINAGVSGNTSAQALARVGDYEDIDILILGIGGNDGLAHQSLSQMKENINAIIDYYSDQGTTVVLSGLEIPVLHGFKYKRDFKNIYFEIAKQREDEIYFFESFLKDVGGIAKYNQSDRIHPTADGYDIIVAHLFEFLEEEKIIEK